MKRYGPGSPPRLRGWDYSRAAAYFVTFNVAKRERCLCRIERGSVRLSEWGEVVDRCWSELPERFPDVRLDAYVIMPDHVHAVVVLSGGGRVWCGGEAGLMNQARTGRRREAGFVAMMADARLVLGKVVRAWKAKSTHLIRQAGKPAFGWQSRYYERIIRDRPHLEAVRRYIRNNPAAWHLRRP